MKRLVKSVREMDKGRAVEITLGVLLVIFIVVFVFALTSVLNEALPFGMTMAVSFLVGIGIGHTFGILAYDLLAGTASKRRREVRAAAERAERETAETQRIVADMIAESRERTRRYREDMDRV